MNFIITLLVCALIAGCSDGGNSNNPASVDDRITTQAVLGGIDTPFYDEANYSNLRLSPDNKFLYAIEYKYNGLSTSIAYFEYDDSTHKYVFKGDITSTTVGYYDSFELSNDGRNLYVISENQITILNRDETTGLLSLGFTLQNTQVSDSFGPFNKLVLDSSDQFAYASSGFNNIAVFYRNQTTGQLTLSEQQNIDSNLLLKKMILSNDNKSMYFICSDSILTATRDASTGALTFGQGFGGGAGISDTLWNFATIADTALVGDDSLLVFANAYIKNGTSTSGSYRSLVVLQRDTASGNLSYVKSLKFDGMAGGDPFVRGSILFDAANSYFYVLSENLTTPVSSTNQLIKLHGNPLGNVFSVFDTTDLDDFDYYRSLDGVIRSDGSQLLISKKYDGSHIVSVIPDNASVNNDITAKLKTYNNTNEGLSVASNALVSPDGQYVYTFTKSDNHSIAIYHLDATTGELSYVDTRQMYSTSNPYPIFMLPLALTLPSQVILDTAAITPDGNQLLMLSEDGIVCLNRDETTGELTNPQTSQGGVYQIWDNNGAIIATSTQIFFDTTLPRFTPDSLAISPDGQFIYVSGVASDESTALAIVSRNLSTGELQLVGIYDTALPSGDIYSINAFIPRSPLISNITHDGKYLYLSNPNIATLVVIKLNTDTGMAEAISYIQNGMNDSTGMPYAGLSNVSSIRFSSDDRFIYLASDDMFGGPTNDVSLQVLERDSSTGDLLVTQIIKRNGTNNVDPALFPADDILDNGKTYLFSRDVILGGARTIDISSDGKNLYMLTQMDLSEADPIAMNGYSVDVYNIEQSTGMVDLVQRYKSGISGIGVSSLRSVPGSNYLIVTNDRYGAVDVLTK